jgi:hypothetical protein
MPVSALLGAESGCLWGVDGSAADVSFPNAICDGGIVCMDESALVATVHLTRVFACSNF